MSFSLFNKKKNTEKLKHYKSILEDFRTYFHSQALLTSKQVKALDYFIDISLSYCINNKYINYQKNSNKYDSTLVANYKQIKIYRHLLVEINSIISDVNQDNDLSESTKKNLAFYLNLAQCHIVGKLNSGAKKHIKPK